jgi:hypothetical protein
VNLPMLAGDRIEQGVRYAVNLPMFAGYGI